MTATSKENWEEKAPNLTAATLQASARDLLYKYYQRIHNRTLSDDEIASILNQTRDAALDVHDYPCLRGFRFSYPRMCRHPKYAEILARLPRPLSSITAVDIGTCMGADIRQLILEGFLPQNIFGLEYELAFLNIGLDVLFCDRNTLEYSMIQCDILNNDNDYNNNIKNILSYTDNHGVNLIYTGSVYHLFSEKESKLMTKRIFHLLKPNGIFFGRTIGIKNDNNNNNNNNNNYKPNNRTDYFTEETFIEMLKEFGFININISSNPFDRLDSDNNNNNNNNSNNNNNNNNNTEHHDDPHGRVFLAFMAIKPSTNTNNNNNTTMTDATTTSSTTTTPVV